MNEASLTQKFLKEGQAIVNRNSKLVSAVEKALKESSNRNLSSLDKIKLATVIDNVSNLLMMNEADSHTEVKDIAKKQEFLNLVVCAWAKSTLPVATMTFAMTQETSVVYYLAYKYANNKGGVQAGDLLNGATADEEKVTADQYWNAPSTQTTPAWDFDPASRARSLYASEIIEGETFPTTAANGTVQLEFAPVVPESVSIDIGGTAKTDDGEGNITGVGTIDYATGIVTVTTAVTADTVVNYKYDNQECPVQVPQLKLEVSKLLLNARAYTLGYTYSTFAAFNLLRTQNVDLKDLLGEGAANELVAEVDALVYDDMLRDVATMPGVTFNMNYTGYFSEKEYYQGFANRLEQAKQLIWQKTRKIRPNVAIMGLNGAYLARQQDGFVSQEQANPVGTHVIGKIKDLVCIENPFMNEDLVILTYKGNDFTGSYAVGEYMPVVQTQLLQYEDFRNSASLATMIAKKKVNAAFFSKVVITHI